MQHAESPHGEESPKHAGDPVFEAAKEWHEKTDDNAASTCAHAAESIEGGAESVKQAVTEGAESAEGAGSGEAAEKAACGEFAEGSGNGDAPEKPHGSPIADRLHAVEHSIATHASGAAELVVQAEQSIQHAIGHGFEAVKKKIVGESGAQPSSTSNAA